MTLNGSTTTAGYSTGTPTNCTFLNRVSANTCAWAALEINGKNWYNASVSLDPGGRGLVLTTVAAVPPKQQQPHDSSKLVIREAESELHGVRVAGDAAVTINATGSSYGYGPIPMMSVETVETKLPVMPWNTSSEIELMEIDRSSQLPRLA
jgi:hypothetical protein